MGLMDTRWETIVPFIVMALMEACTIALTILAKTALTGGMSPFVFIVYTNALGSLLLLPYSFYFHRDESDDEPFLTKPSLVRIFLLGFTGVFLFQNMAFLGLSYSSPIVVCAMGLQSPAFSFLLSLALGKEGGLGWASKRTKGRVIGTLICFTGAFVEVIYLGPFIRPSPPSSPTSNFLTTISHYLTFFKNSDNWALGSLLLACATLSISIWNIIQLDTVQKYPQVMKVVSAYSLAGTLQCAIFSAFMEPDLSAWELKLNMDLYLIIATGIFGSIIRTSVQVKCSKMKGPYYVPLFKPFGILWASIFGTSFFVNSLHYGSVLGAAIAGTGYLLIMWSQVQKDDPNETVEKNDNHQLDSDEQTTPLLLANGDFDQV
ncbi:WAT1-related protein [Arabidopsis thaliana]|jgi:hypothetical protein|uniref:WAT1-related protein At1g60050 n=3 Tax=Arabidopsis TaxID=3701 RepID=WTR9_ARATH|nr:Nodulin MtN21 /EamA-like transporter family protein [Arabidopsis thaliana]Q9ZUI8.1 RecName: Full=WAT1-related protein At1g60050 [Arabidopsis thaliana]KAG7650042.1 EamA domain [Arabidopsis thaliana x Arabidopsis arenosa]AAD14481.1 Similar to gi/4056506 F3G5.25 nodulin-like protein from Arabidopsis thaliana BAC gb/AC005896 [Arabidopsis thaliana]AEE33653.1 Nodulin MtN21 /EamA-like transporter family protein [Arabidopsis thaliana]OAP17478.1 UMAMIT35 [Arabidopsis thaliana]CAA0303923.1 unnamed p|eukprot:NP_176213.1 Nodulin MtN21 /EamA-like transporter family protein [Arabidopsis thaliana]